VRERESEREKIRRGFIKSTTGFLVMAVDGGATPSSQWARNPPTQGVRKRRQRDRRSHGKSAPIGIVAD